MSFPAKFIEEFKKKYKKKFNFQENLKIPHLSGKSG
jgi:hypothetical protein